MDGIFKEHLICFAMFWDAILNGRDKQGHVGVTSSGNVTLVPVDRM